MSGKSDIKRILLLLTLLMSVLSSCVKSPQEPPDEPETLADLLAGLDALPPEAFMEEAFKRLALRDPEFVTQVGVADLYGVRNNALRSYDPVDLEMTLAFESGLLSLAMAYDQSAMTEAERLDLQVFMSGLRKGQPCIPTHGWRFLCGMKKGRSPTSMLPC